MIYEFDGFRLDGARRELLFEGREVQLQPRVFDLLSYLIANRERVVSKDELLDAIWPDTMVTEGSLKRAVSLARSALRRGNGQDRIRTYSRQGYRFCADEISEANDDPTEGARSTALDSALQAYAEGRWIDAAHAFAEADAEDALEASHLERWAEAAQLSGHAMKAVAPLERAVAVHGAASDSCGVARAALGLALIHFERLELSVAKGWLRRARTVLPEQPVTEEHGILAGLASRFAVSEGELDRSVEEAERAVEIGRELENADIELLAMGYLGIALVARGDVKRGIAVHDEAAAMVLGGVASPLVGGLVYCGLIWTCRNRGDWQRAAEWTDSFRRWCGRRSIELFSGNCRLHRAEVLHHQGELAAAEREVVEARALLAELAPYAEGDACRVLGDLRLARGDLDAAETAFRRAHELGWDPNPGLAQLQMARGKARAGLRALERSLGETRWANRQRRGLLLANVVMVALAAEQPERAREAFAELEANPDLWGTMALEAAVLEARAELCAHEGDTAGASAVLREAIQAWHRVGAPLHVARRRLRLAELYILDDDPDAAELELSAARGHLEKLGARPAEYERVVRMLAEQ